MNGMTKKRIANKKQGGFTLIELLVVIGIITILTVTVIIAINPGQLLAQARDSNRLSDLQSMKTAIDLFYEDTGGTKSLGSAGITYLSVPDPAATTTAGSDCSSLGFPAGYFHCAASSTYRRSDGTGWIPLNFDSLSTGSPLSQLPKDSINTTSSEAYYAYATDGTNYKVSAVPEATKNLANLSNFSQGSGAYLQGGFPDTWVKVPGNGTFGTNDFYAMQYDAKCADNKGNLLTSPTESTYLTYQNNATTTAACTPAYNKQITSAASGYPITEISQTNAASYCASIGAHLMTNAEWQTIAWDAEGVASNWSGGVIASGTMPRGNSNSSAAQSDSSVYGTGYSNFLHLRTLTLSNGQVIWDMAGNVWQWTNDTILGTQKPVGSGGTGGWSEWPTVTTYYAGPLPTEQTAGPSIASWDSTKGIGQYYEGGNGGTTYAFLRGGYWSDGAHAGVESLLLDHTPGSTDFLIGFRCAR
jgi:prepilin-type N-terminal cleavage/methylation domain-containing protein